MDYTNSQTSRPKYDETASGYTAKLVIKFGSKSIAHFFVTKDLVSKVGFLATFKRACNKNCINEDVVIKVLIHYVNEKLPCRLCTYMFAPNMSTLITSSVRGYDSRWRKFLHWCHEVIIC